MFNLNEKQRFSLRKLSVGLASVCIGLSFVNMTSKEVKADTVSAQTSVAETKTSETNNVDANADASKEVAKSTNSVDSNKITPSQTVLDKQAMSNDVLKGTDVKQEQPVETKQETPVKQAPVNEQPTVSNKDANINLNSNLTKNSDEPSLETSLLKDTTKPETTNTFHVRKFNIQANVNALRESKAADPNTNGGFDSSWGTLDVNAWKGSIQGDYYQLTDYTGDANHVIVPNEADFEKAGISTSGKQVGVTSDLMHTIFIDKTTAQDATVAFSKTNNKMVKAIGTDWHNTWEQNHYYSNDSKGEIGKFDGTNLDVSNVTNMNGMFANNQISDISSLATWDTSNVTDMGFMFNGCKSLNDISSLATWDTSKVNIMGYMFENCSNLSDLSSLAHWDISNVTNMYFMFNGCESLSDISPLAHWDTSKVTSMGYMFSNCNNLSDISPLAHWDTSKVNIMIGMFKNTSLKKVTLTNWDFSNINPSYGSESIFPDTNFEATLSDKTSKSLLDIASKLSDSVKEAIKEYQYYLTQEQFNQYKQEIQQKINQYKLQAEYPLTSVFGNHSKITTPNQDLLVYLVGKLPVKSDATRTIKITFPDGTKKTINQSVGYGKYAISGTADMATHKLDMAMPYELSKWELIKKEDGSYDLVKAHVDKNGVASFDNVALPKIPGYKACIEPVSINPNMMLFSVSFMALPKVSSITSQKVTPKPAKPVPIETQLPVETHDSLSNSTLTTTDPIPDTLVFNNIESNELTWQIVNKNLNSNSIKIPYNLTNTIYKLRLPRYNNYELHLLKRGTTQDSVSFVYINKQTQLNYVFNLKIQDNKYYLTVGKIDRVNRKILPIKTYNVISYQDLLDIFDKYFK